MYWYWWVWFAIVVFLICLPLAYGWGYRGWGPPYPRPYYRRRRAGDLRGTPVGAETRPGAPSGGTWEEPPVTTGVGASWGIVGDLIWLAAFGALVWAIVAAAH